MPLELRLKEGSREARRSELKKERNECGAGLGRAVAFVRGEIKRPGSRNYPRGKKFPGRRFLSFRRDEICIRSIFYWAENPALSGAVSLFGEGLSLGAKINYYRLGSLHRKQFEFYNGVRFSQKKKKKKRKRNRCLSAAAREQSPVTRILPVNGNSIFAPYNIIDITLLLSDIFSTSLFKATRPACLTVRTGPKRENPQLH